MTVPPLALSDSDQALLEGAAGPAQKLAMEIVVTAAGTLGAEGLVDIAFAHINACFLAGQVYLDFAEFLVAGGARLAVPAMTNVGLADLRHPERRPDAAYPEMADARRLMALYEDLGCDVVFTCAPYQLPRGRPARGTHIAVAESNAVAFYNSALGARSNKCGDFLDMAAALTGRVPLAGLHLDRERRGRWLFRLEGFSEAALAGDLLPHLLGHHLGGLVGAKVPVIVGLPPETGEDALKAIGAAGASSGALALFHLVGVTPEAPDLETAFQGQAPEATYSVTPADLRRAAEGLTTGSGRRIDAVSLGTPHFSLSEMAALVEGLAGRRIDPELRFFVSTSRFLLDLARERGWAQTLETAGIDFIVDTCSYYAPRVRGLSGRVMTNSAKWAYYAPGILGVDVAFGSLADCIESAVAGELRRADGGAEGSPSWL